MTRVARRAAVAVLAAGALTASAVQAGAATTAADRHWAPPAKATVHPGVTVTIAGVKCVAGFIVKQRHRVFLTLPASCSGVSDGQPVDGCVSAQVPVGLKVPIEGARHRGTIAYSSFTEMQLSGERRINRCTNNSLTLIRIDRRDVKRTNPSLPVLGGPTGLQPDATAAPGQLTVLLSGAATTAQATSTTAGGWAHGLVIDGQADNLSVGSPVVDPDGKAVGMVTVVPFHGLAGESTVSDLARELRALRRTPGFHHVHLVKGTQDFRTASLPLPTPLP